jgi:hypothetical protein
MLFFVDSPRPKGNSIDGRRWKRFLHFHRRLFSSQGSALNPQVAAFIVDEKAVGFGYIKDA